jgi:formylmethanofuran dehydrogenase subunit D
MNVVVVGRVFETHQCKSGFISPRRWASKTRPTLQVKAESRVTGKRFIMNAGRTTKQGQQINIGKDSPEYQAIVNTLTMHPDDMKEVGIVSGGTVRVSSDNGQALFQCKEGKVPRGMIFVPYGPPTCRLMGQTTDGTGMPTSKGWEVEVEPISGNPGEKQ